MTLFKLTDSRGNTLSATTDVELCNDAWHSLVWKITNASNNQVPSLSDQGNPRSPFNNSAPPEGGGEGGASTMTERTPPAKRMLPATNKERARRTRDPRSGERMWWTAGTTRGGAGHLGLTHTKTQRGRLRTA